VSLGSALGRRGALGPDLVVVDEHMPWAAKYLTDPVGRRILDQPRVFHPVKERLECRVDFQPREGTAETDVNSAPPAHVLVVGALGVERVGVGEAPRIPVGRGVYEING